MTNDELVLSYLNNHFEVVLHKRPQIKQKGGESNMNLDSFIHETNDLFGFRTTDVVKHWAKIGLDELTGDVRTYLSKCNLFLGRTNWEIRDADGHEFTEDMFLNRFKDWYDDRFLRGYFDEWYNNELIQASDRIWKLGDY